MSRQTQPETTEGIEYVRFSDLESRREQWSKLAERAGNVFATWEWASTWWEEFGSTVKPAFLECRDQHGRVFAILPLCIERQGLKLLRFLGHGVGDVLGPICDPGDSALAGRALRGAVEFLGAPSLLLAEHLPGGAMPEALGGRLLVREANPFIEIEGKTWEAYLGTRSKNLREKLRRSTRKLEDSHQVTFRLCDEPGRVESDMRQLVSLHRMRWSEGSNFGRESSVDFHLRLAPILFDRGWLRLWTMEVDAEPAAAWYGFRYGETESFFQSGRDPGFDGFSVGFLLLTRTIRAAFDDGLDRYGFLRGDEPYKDRFAGVDHGLESRVYGRGPLGAPGMVAASLAVRSKRVRSVAAAALGRRRTAS